MNILIAEDLRILQMTHQAMMEQWGFYCDIASNGAEAVKLAESKQGYYDCCLMDVSMPVMNGIDATRVIRNNSKYFPILGYSSDLRYRDDCLEAGMDDFMAKPCPPPILLSKILTVSVKLFRVITKQKPLIVTEEMPVDKKHAQELQNLKKQGLIKMRLDGPDEREVIAHRNAPNKISHDFNVLKQSMTEFLNRDPDRPTLCDLYRGSKSIIIETFIDDEDYNERLRSEDEMMDSHQTKYYGTDEESK
jgi:CheY-like chemotaxis protein